MYRFVNELLEPQRLAMLGLAVALTWLWWRNREGRRPLLAAIVPFCVLWGVSLPVTTHFSNTLLQGRYRPLEARPVEAQCIVVLSGFALPRDARRPQPVLGEDTLYRCLHAAELYRRGPRCPVVVSGGLVNPAADMPPLGHQMRDFLMELGVAETDILIEDGSTTTYENAEQCAKLLAGRQAEAIVLVTDALHMQRAERCFLHAGLKVVPAPCQMQNERFEWSLSGFLPSAAAAWSMQEVTHEILGLIWYKLKGRIS